MRTAVVGLGAIAPAHLEKLRWLPGVRVAAVCDLSAPAADAMARRYGVDGAYTDAMRMLDEVRPDVVHVLTPPASHRALAGAALEAGAHVLLEKPAATSMEDLDALRDLATRHGRMLVENHNYRFAHTALRALEAVRSGTIGDVVSVDVSMAVSVASPGPYTDPVTRHFAHDLPGGALFNFATHPASLLAVLLDEIGPVRTWTARRGALSQSDDELRALVGGRVPATLSLSSHGRPEGLALRITGTAASLEADVFGRRLVVVRNDGGIDRLASGVRRARHELRESAALAAGVARGRADWFEGLRTLLVRLYAAVRDGRSPPVTDAELVRTNRLVHELFRPENQL